MIAVCGLTFGDEGKGSIVDALVRRLGARDVVRWNGGPQAGHNVVAPDGRWHCFAQVGAGSFVPGARTLLAPGMLVELEALAVELEVLAARGAWARIVIDPECTLVTPMHKLVNQLEELARGADRRGTCGMGVGEAARGRAAGADVRVRHVLAGARHRLAELAAASLARARAVVAGAGAAAVLEQLAPRCDPEALDRRYRAILRGLTVDTVAPRPGAIFEGAQGALLDGRRGFVPYVTQSSPTFHGVPGALRVGVVRAHGHRHGPGPFVTEDARLAERLADPYNPENRWQGRFRVGDLDLVALRHGLLLAGGADRLAVTHVDRAAARMCTAYGYRGDLARLDAHFEWEPTGPESARITAIRVPPPGAILDGERAALLLRCRPLEWREVPEGRVVEVVEEALGVPAGIVSRGPTASDKSLDDIGI